MTSVDRQTYHVTKYPNRRLYDATSRRYVTLSDLYAFVRDGHEIVVSDKTTGRDITNIILTQIILEHDPPKMDLFPASLLHQAIQMNETMARSFIDQYLGKAMDAFARSRSQFDAFLKQSGIPTIPTVAAPMDWMRMLMPGMAPVTEPPHGPNAPSHRDRASEPVDEPVNEPAPDEEIESLKRQIAALGEQMAQLRQTPTPGARSLRKKSAKKKKVRKK